MSSSTHLLIFLGTLAPLSSPALALLSLCSLQIDYRGHSVGQTLMPGAGSEGPSL